MSLKHTSTWAGPGGELKRKEGGKEQGGPGYERGFLRARLGHHGEGEAAKGLNAWPSC